METLQTRSVQIPPDYHTMERAIRSREKHLDILVVLWVVVGVFYVAYGLALAAIMVIFAGTDGSLDPDLRLVLPILAIATLLTCLVMAGWFMITAWGLHRRRGFGRVSSYVLAVLLILTGCFMPVGIYGLWVLVGRYTDMAFGHFPEGKQPILVKAAPASRPPRPAPPRQRNLTPLPPDSRPRRAGLESYPRPPVAATTPPMGVPRHMPGGSDATGGGQGQDGRRSDINSLPTVQDMPAPTVGKKSRSS